MLKLYDDTYISQLADAIRDKNRLETLYKLEDMPGAVNALTVYSDLLTILGSDTTFNLKDGDFITDAVKIPAYCFYNCANIREVELEGITEIGAYAFAGSGITKAIFPNCVSVGDFAFYQRNDLKNGSINLDNCESFGVSAFEGCAIGDPAPSHKITFEKTKSIGNKAFYESGKVFEQGASTELTMPLCESIGASAFANYYQQIGFNLLTLDLPKIKTIGDYAFRWDFITNLKLGADCTSIGTGIFYNSSCTNLYCYATTPPTLAGTFIGWAGDYSAVTNIYVPAESVDAYKAANIWSGYASKIQAMPS